MWGIVDYRDAFDKIRHLKFAFRAAAGQSTNAVEAAYLSGLADRFQQLEEAGAGATESPAQSLSRSAAS
jgi:hypothetical protein